MPGTLKIEWNIMNKTYHNKLMLTLQNQAGTFNDSYMEVKESG